MKVFDIYCLFSIPPNLERHMYQVAKVGEFVTTHWSGEPIDSQLITKICLLHDVGNIVKFKKPLWEELAPDAEHWEKIQSQMIGRYGMKASKATYMMLKDIRVETSLLDFVNNMSLVAENIQHLSWEVRIAEYADMCVSPEGIVGIEARLSDLQIRYPDTSAEVISGLQSNASEVESQVDVKLTNMPELVKLSDEDVERYRKVEIELES